MTSNQSVAVFGAYGPLPCGQGGCSTMLKVESIP